MIVATRVGGALSVAIVKVCDEAPAGIVTEAGTIASGELLASDTAAPPSGAGVGSETMPVIGRPPGTDVGPTDKASWPIVSAAVRATPA